MFVFNLVVLLLVFHTHIMCDWNVKPFNTAGRYLRRFISQSKFKSLLHDVPMHGDHHLVYALVTDASWKLEILDELGSDHKPLLLHWKASVAQLHSLRIS